MKLSEKEKFEILVKIFDYKKALRTLKKIGGYFEYVDELQAKNMLQNKIDDLLLDPLATSISSGGFKVSRNIKYKTVNISLDIMSLGCEDLYGG